MDRLGLWRSSTSRVCAIDSTNRSRPSGMTPVGRFGRNWRPIVATELPRGCHEVHMGLSAGVGTAESAVLRQSEAERVQQSVAKGAQNPDSRVGGYNRLATPLLFFVRMRPSRKGLLAQLVEQWTLNPTVASSNLARPTNFLRFQLVVAAIRRTPRRCRATRGMLLPAGAGAQSECGCTHPAAAHGHQSRPHAHGQEP